MKRFYCTICKRIKRVRKYPVDVQHVTNESPEYRKGTCTWHSRSITSTSPRIYSKVGQ